MNERKTVVILGASNRKERYSNRAQRLLTEHGFHVVPVHPTQMEIEGLPVTHDLGDIAPEPDVLTVYVQPAISSRFSDTIIALHPKVVIFNPGTENPELEQRLTDMRSHVVHACTIMLLTTGQFGSMTHA